MSVERALAGVTSFFVAANSAYAVMAIERKPMIVPPKYVCVQVFSFNEADVIEDSLRSILSQDIIKAYRDRFKLQVFDGGSTDGTVGIARSLGFEVIVLPRGKLRARNYSVIAFPECRIHVHIDADTVLPSWWVRNVLWHFKDPEVVAVTTPRIYGVPAIVPLMVIARGFGNIDGRIYGSNCAIRHDAFMKTLFDLRYDGTKYMVLEEEIRFYDRLRKLGKVAYDPTPAFTRPVTKKYIT